MQQFIIRKIPSKYPNLSTSEANQLAEPASESTSSTKNQTEFRISKNKAKSPTKPHIISTCEALNLASLSEHLNLSQPNRISNAEYPISNNEVKSPSRIHIVSTCEALNLASLSEHLNLRQLAKISSRVNGIQGNSLAHQSLRCAPCLAIHVLGESQHRSPNPR